MKALIPIMVEFHKPMEPTMKFTSDGWRVPMPVGSEIVTFGLDQQANIIAFVLQEAKGVAVVHPLLLIPVGAQYDPVIGRKVGRGWGVWMPPNLGPIGIFADDPWPKHTLLPA